MRRTTFVLLVLSCLVQMRCQENGNATTYNPEELLSKIFNFNGTITSRKKYGFIKFEDNFEPQTNDENRPITFEETGPISSPSGPNSVFRFEDDPITNNGDDKNFIQPTNNQDFTFQDDNKIEEPKPPKKKRRRRRRPKNQNFGYLGSVHQFQGGAQYEYPNVPQGYPSQYPGNIPQGYPSQYPGNIPQGVPGQDPNTQQGYPGQYPGNIYQSYSGQYPGYPQGVSGQSPEQYPYPYPGGPTGPFHRPPRRPKQSLASEALTAVTEALSSIALYDDYQCVPRLLCEAAGGGALGSSSILQNIAGLQPLLTLLAAYNGVSSSPLFIFGRAVFLGMTAKGNMGSCRYAYPQCPTDPEQLVHYLNNHNGGFFRFFNAPQINNPQGQQNVEQFYNQLSQNYGIYQPGPSQLPIQQNYGIYQPNVPNQQNIGNYQTNLPPQFNYQNLQANPQSYGFPDPNLYGRPQNYGIQNYGATYPYQNKYANYKSNDKGKKKKKIEKRILNRPLDNVSHDNLENNDNPKWFFPELSGNNENYNNYRGGRDFKFPDEVNKQDYTSTSFSDTRKGKGFSFPNYQNNIKFTNYYKETSTTPSYNSYGLYQNQYHAESTTQNVVYQNVYDSNVKYNYDNNNNYNKDNINQNGNSEGLETVYVIRGNGDPNHPEIVKLRPGEKLQ